MLGRFKPPKENLASYFSETCNPTLNCLETRFIVFNKEKKKKKNILKIHKYTHKTIEMKIFSTFFSKETKVKMVYFKTTEKRISVKNMTRFAHEE